MAKAQILIVENDAITAMDIENQLKKLGYGITAAVAYGEEAVKKVKENTPDLVLMDIALKGEIDGIAAAKEIRTKFDIPVVFLTAFADKERLKHAKFTYPYGFIVKPCQHADLSINIEMALYYAEVDAERKQAVEALQKAHDELKKSVAKRTAELNKIKAINTLAGGIAHQFNNALSGITGNIDLIEMDLPDNTNIAGYLRQMKGSVDRMTKLTNQLLAYARGGKYQPEVMSLNAFVENVLPLIQHGMDHSIKIETDLSTDILSINADPAQMQMVFSAILTNASEAIEGKGLIRISIRGEEIDDEFIKYHSALNPGYHACLEIDDNGQGMDNETRSKVFEPFFSTKSPGRGLGMAAAYGVVKNHNGWISVYSEAGRGTVVRIYLPAIEAPTKIPATPKSALPKDSGTILLVEDEEIVRDVGQALLERLGYRVLVAVNGREAISIAKSYDGNIDLAMLDIMLPDIEGKEVYPQLMEARPNLKVIVCSGYSIDGPAREILNEGAQGFIQKPFNLTALLDKLEEVLKG